MMFRIFIRAQKTVAQLQQQIDVMKDLKASDEGLQDQLQKIRVKYRQLKAVLGVNLHWLSQTLLFSLPNQIQILSNSSYRVGDQNPPNKTTKKKKYVQLDKLFFLSNEIKLNTLPRFLTQKTNTQFT